MFHLKNFLDPGQDGVSPVQDGVSYWVRESYEIADEVMGYVRDHLYEFNYCYEVNPKHYLTYVLDKLGHKNTDLIPDIKDELIDWINRQVNG